MPHMTVNTRSMTDLEFLDYSFKLFFNQAPDSHISQKLLSVMANTDVGREDILMQIIQSPEIQKKLNGENAEFVPSGHFYSAVPSFEDRLDFYKSPAKKPTQISSIDLNAEQQHILLEQFICYFNECPFPEESSADFRYYFNNGIYGHADGLTLFAMMRKFQPKRIIEVDSGFSSALMLDTNDSYFNGEIELTFIEPYPKRLNKLLRASDNKQKILNEKIQDTDLQIFQSLEENDILFIDSTHVSKLNSDVNHILFNIIPELKDGVLIHFHDIFWPFEYMRGWIREGRAWNEAYLLRAFLQYNEHFEILFFADYLQKQHRSRLSEDAPRFLKNTGGNIWLRKKAAR